MWLNWVISFRLHTALVVCIPQNRLSVVFVRRDTFRYHRLTNIRTWISNYVELYMRCNHSFYNDVGEIGSWSGSSIAVHIMGWDGPWKINFIFSFWISNSAFNWYRKQTEMHMMVNGRKISFACLEIANLIVVGNFQKSSDQIIFALHCSDVIK